ncbi:MAG: S41 family peptidase [Sarcina sp.]
MGKINNDYGNKGFKVKRRITFTLFTVTVFLFALFLGNRLTAKGVLPITNNSGLQSVFNSVNKNIGSYDELFKVREQLYRYYDGEIDDEKLVEGAIKGMTAALNDPYTYYMNKSEFEEFNEHNSGKYMGLGLQVAVKDNKIIIVEPIEGGPAEKTGIEAGDILLSVNGTDVSGEDLKKATEMMKGTTKEVVDLKIDRKGEILDKKVTRDEVKRINIKGHLVDGDIGYIEIVGFEKNVAKDFNEKLKELKAQGMKKLILDVRGNPGGYMNECVDIISNFVPKDKLIVSTKDKQGKEEKSLSKGGDAIGMPLVLLINENSASASEIVAGAIRDYEIGTLVGKKTFGKGIVQTVINQDEGKGLKLTISRYYTPNGENIHKKGIAPDVEVDYEMPLSRKDYNQQEDIQFNKALEILKK